MTTIYDLINVLPFESHNWFSNAAQLQQIFDQNNIKTVIEVGSWFGGSTRWFAKQLPGDGFVVAVDTWKGSEEHQPGAFAHHTKLDVLCQQFLSNNIHENLQDKIVPVRMESLEAAKAISLIPDLFYLDAAHDEESVYNDLKTWVPNFNEKTIICGDDWGWETVRAAVERFAGENNLKAIGNGNFWVLQKA